MSKSSSSTSRKVRLQEKHEKEYRSLKKILLEKAPTSFYKKSATEDEILFRIMIRYHWLLGRVGAYQCAATTRRISLSLIDIESSISIMAMCKFCGVFLIIWAFNQSQKEK